MAHAAAQVIVHQAASPEMVRAIGASRADALSQEAQRTLAVLAQPETEACARAAVDLARRCIGLAAEAEEAAEAAWAAEPDEVERDFDDGTVRCSEEIMDEAWDWDFGVVIAEAMANGLAAAAVLLPYSSDSMELLVEISRDLDCLAVHLFGGLCRLQPLATTVREARLRAALSGICIWALECLCRTIGYERFNPTHLWEFAACDHIWALALAGGVLAFVEGSGCCSSLGGTLAVDLPPEDMDRLQRVALAATCGLPTPTVAFLAEVDGQIEESEDTTIAERSMWLSRHRLLLASAVVECDTSGLLIRACARVGAGPDLAALLVALLQPELVRDPDWVTAHPEATERMQEARAAAAALSQHLQCYASQLWDAATIWPSTIAQHSMISFFTDCASLAYFVRPPSDDVADRLFTATGADCSRDPGVLAALCVLAANAGQQPSGPLSEAIGSLDAESRTAVAARWERWRGPVSDIGLTRWARLLDGASPARGLARQAAAVVTTGVVRAAIRNQAAAAAAAALASMEGETIGGGGESLAAKARAVQQPAAALQRLMVAAPAEFRCMLDGSLMMDPVRTPQGYVFERLALSRALAEQPFCPVTGGALSLEQCVRLPDLRRRIKQWIREARPRPSGA